MDVSPKEAHRLILKGKAPRGLRVEGFLDFTVDRTDPLHLPEDLEVSQLNLSGCSGFRSLPRGLKATRLLLDDCPNLETLPDGLECYSLSANRTPLRSFPAGVKVDYKLELRECPHLTSLPAGLRVGSLDLAGCPELEELPEGIDVDYLDLSGCPRFERWPARGAISFGHLNVRGCPRLASLPPWLRQVSHLDVSGCALLTSLPESLEVTGWIALEGSGLRELPGGEWKAPVLWRGVPVEERIIFRPETIRASEILEETNAERRRVLLERCGYERFMKEAEAVELDRDTDPGGERRLLRVPLDGDEALVCLSCFCPSTGRQYVLRVPPDTPTCRHAAAWIAGFDNPDDYRPLIET